MRQRPGIGWVRMGRNYRSLVGSVLAAQLATGAMQPAAASELAAAIHVCTQEPSDARRLACYDAAAGHTGAPAVSAGPSRARTAAKSSEVAATITQLLRHADGRYAITLSNGEVWQEVETRERFQANIGDAVTLRTEVLGARYLHMPGGTDVRVSPVTASTPAVVSKAPTNAAQVSASAPASALAPVPPLPTATATATATAKATAKAAAPSTQITATITNLTRKADGRFVITLNNGEVWLQAETKERFLASVGDVISLRTQLLGAHYLRTPKGSDVRVLLQPG
jgi:hypothetical protein